MTGPVKSLMTSKLIEHNDNQWFTTHPLRACQHIRPKPSLATFACLLSSSQSPSKFFSKSFILVSTILRYVSFDLRFIVYHMVSIAKKSWWYPNFLSSIHDQSIVMFSFNIQYNNCVVRVFVGCLIGPEYLTQFSPSCVQC